MLQEKSISKKILPDRRGIKGLGPAAASILYFLHPTTIQPFHTAIVNGSNRLFNDKVKLGSWSEYLRMRETVVEKNDTLKSELAGAGMVFLAGFPGILLEKEPDEWG